MKTIWRVLFGLACVASLIVGGKIGLNLGSWFCRSYLEKPIVKSSPLPGWPFGYIQESGCDFDAADFKFYTTTGKTIQYSYFRVGLKKGQKFKVTTDDTKSNFYLEFLDENGTWNKQLMVCSSSEK